MLCCRTDNGGEFDAELDTQLKQQRIRHECRLPYRPQTNARAERFHRTLAEGMRSLMLMSGLPDVFGAFCLAAFGYLYARSPFFVSTRLFPPAGEVKHAPLCSDSGSVYILNLPFGDFFFSHLFPTGPPVRRQS